MTYTIISAAYANDGNSAAILMTEEAAAVLISAVDTPEEWVAMLAWGEPSAYVPPPPPPQADPVDKLVAFLNSNPDVRALLQLSPQALRTV